MVLCSLHRRENVIHQCNDLLKEPVFLHNISPISSHANDVCDVLMEVMSGKILFTVQQNEWMNARFIIGSKIQRPITFISIHRAS